MSLVDIANRVSDAYSGFVTNLFGRDGARDWGAEDRNLIGSNPNKYFSKSLGYGFKVINPGNTGFTSDSEFVLQINPQTLEQDEEFSIQFFPTPDGITTEHQGSIMKDIVISGVTGNHPKKGSGGVDKNGNLIGKTGRSGYLEFHELRNFIRAYVEYKKDPVNKEMELHFYNFKDREYLIVEPTRFTLKRDRSRPFMYEYNISLKATSRVDIASIVDNNRFSALATIDSVFEDVSNAIDVARGTLLELISLVQSVDKDVRAKIINPLNTVSSAISEFRAGYTTAINLPSKFMRDLKNTCREIGDKFAGKSGVELTDYNILFGKKNSFVSETPRDPTYNDRRVLSALTSIEKSMSKIVFNQAPFSQTTSDTAAVIENAYDNRVTIEKPNSTTMIKINHGQTVQDIAAKHLGDSSKYKDLVVLNNLKYPYIAEERSSGVLSYNDSILIPQNTTINRNIRDVYQNAEYEITKNLSEGEKALGVDIRLNESKDIAITNTNDIDLIAGADNVLQTIGVRMGVEPGSYKLHMKIGITPIIGKKTTFSTATLEQEILQQLKDDSRIEDGSTVETILEDNKIYVNIKAKIKVIGQTLPLQLVTSN